MLIERVKYRFAMAGCFPDFRGRASSFDLHNLSPGHKMSLISKLFRSKSDTGLKIGRRSPTGSPTSSPRESPRDSPRESPRESPRGSPGAPPRRRFVRVIRDDRNEGEEYVNPHVIRKYNRGFIETKYMKKSSSLDDSDKPLPYVVTGHTILKKHHSMEHAHSVDSECQKHACFKEEVEIMEYNAKAKCAVIMNDACIVHQRLHDDTIEVCVETDLDSGREEVTAVEYVDSDLVSKVLPLDISLEVIDEHKPLHDGTNQIQDTVTTEKSDSIQTEKSDSLQNTWEQDAQTTDEKSENEKQPPVERQGSQDSQDSQDGISAPKKSKIDSQTKPDDVDLTVKRIDEVLINESKMANNNEDCGLQRNGMMLET